MKMDKMKLGEVKEAISEYFEDAVTKTYCFMLKHPVISTCIGTLTGAAVTAGVSAIARNVNIGANHVTPEEAEEARQKLVYACTRFAEDHPDEWAEMNDE